MKAIRSATTVLSATTASLCVFLIAGCGNFWQAPTGSTSTGTTATTTSLSVTNSSVSAGTSVTLTATVSPSAATGTVTFKNNGNSIGTATLSSGTATSSAITFSAVGSQSLTATYGGDSTYAASTSSAITLTVTAASGSRPVINSTNVGRQTNLVLDPEAAWTPSATVHLHNIAGIVVSGSTAVNIDGGGHCVFYSGSVFLAGSATADGNSSGVYQLSGGGVLAPEGTTGLDCE